VLQLKDLRGRTVGKKVTIWDGEISKEVDRTSSRTCIRDAESAFERWKVPQIRPGWKVWIGRLGGWEKDKEIEARCRRETGGGHGIRYTRERIAWEGRGAKCFAGNGEN
jgi:hypothetical protein